MMPRRLRILALLLCGLAACNGGTAADHRITQIQELQDKLAAQQRQIAERDARLLEQAEVIRGLRGLEEARRIENLVSVAKIDLERLSGPYDDNRDGAPDGLVLYVKLFDAEGDVIKSAGSLNVRVLDLARPDGSHEIGSLQLTPEQLRPTWFGRLLTSHYTVKIPWERLGGRPQTGKLTVLVSFLELLSGRTFEVQKVLDLSARPV